MSYTVHQAKTNLSRLIREAQKGKEVIITRGKEPVARLVPIPGGAKKRIPVPRYRGGIADRCNRTCVPRAGMIIACYG